jgi:hypothetical protein
MTTFDATIGPEVQQAAVNFNASGDNVVILGLVGSRIKVLQFFLVFAGATNITYKSSSTPMSGALSFGSNAAHVLDYMQLPLTCNPGDSFIINSSAAVQVGGTVWYAVIL